MVKLALMDMTSTESGTLSYQILIFSPSESLYTALSAEFTSQGFRVIRINDVKKLDKEVPTDNTQCVNYFIYSFLDISGNSINSAKRSIRKISEHSLKFNSKLLFLLPQSFTVREKFAIRSIVHEITTLKEENYVILNVGDLIGVETSEKRLGYFDNILNSLIKKKKFNLPDLNTVFCPITLSVFAKEVIPYVFTLSLSKSSRSLLGEPLTLEWILQNTMLSSNTFKDNNSRMIIINAENTKDTRIVRSDIIQAVNLKYENLKNLKLNDKNNKFKAFITNIFKKKRKFTSSTKLVKKSQISSLSIVLYRFLLILFIVVLLPFLSLIISGISIVGGGYLMKSGDINASNGVFRIADNFSKFSGMFSGILIENKVLPGFYAKINSQSIFFSEMISVGIETNSFLVLSRNYLVLMGDKVAQNDIKSLDQIKLSSENLIRKLSFLEGEWLDNVNRKVFLKEFYFNTHDLQSLRTDINIFKDLISEAGVLLGYGKPVKYLVIIQKDEIITSTGGTFDKLLLLDIENGKISNISEVDPETLRTNSYGYVEPPKPLKRDFNRLVWNLYDMNWIPDYSSAADKIIKHFDKDQNLLIDGVLTVDRESLKKLFSGTSNENLTIDDINNSNLSETFQQLFNGNKGTLNLKVIYGLLRTKKLLLFSTNQRSQRLITEIGWGGVFTRSECTNPCYSDFVQINEFSDMPGFKKIVKEVDLTINIEEGIVKRELVLFLQNKYKDQYKTYIRLIVGSESGFSPVTITTPDKKSEVVAEINAAETFKEVGVLTTISGFEATAISYKWESPLNIKNGLNEYVLKFSKQPGDINYPVNININYPENLKLDVPQGYSLTEAGVWSYNTNLEEDYYLRLVKKSNE